MGRLYPRCCADATENFATSLVRIGRSGDRNSTRNQGLHQSDKTSKKKKLPQPAERVEEDMSEPKDMSLEEQVDYEPRLEMDSQTEDFETKASIEGDSEYVSLAYKRRWKD